MKIQFCDLCNESVPQSDIDEGRAIVRKGRVICMSCDRAMSHASAAATTEASDAVVVVADPSESAVVLTSDPAPARAPTGAATSPPAENPSPVPTPAPRRSSSAALWVAVLALLFAAVAISVLHRDMGALALENARQEQALSDSRKAVQALLSRFEAADQRRSLQLDRVDAAVLGMRQVFEAEREQAGASADESQKRLAALSDALAEIRAELIAWREDSDRRIAEHDVRFGRTDDELKLLVERFAALESGPMLAADPGAANGAGASAAPAWSGLLVDLASPNAGIRWQAVVGLGDTKDPAVVPNLLPMLADNDVFVRMACARVLGDLGQTTAVPALIDALEDAEAPVREAASIALRSVTGKDLRFDPLGNEADRAKKVKAWREWWKKLQEEQPGDSSTPAPGAPG